VLSVNSFIFVFVLIFLLSISQFTYTLCVRTASEFKMVLMLNVEECFLGNISMVSVKEIMHAWVKFFLHACVQCIHVSEMYVLDC